MMFEKGTKLYSYEIRRESGESVAYINYLGAPFLPDIAKFPEVFSKIVDVLIEAPNVSRIVLVQQRNYNYDSDEVRKISEIANLYNFLLKQEKVLSPERLSQFQETASRRYSFMTFFMQMLKNDPIAAYFKLKNSLSKENDSYFYLQKKILSLLEDTQIIKDAKSYFDFYVFGDRKIYEKIFIPDIIPNYAYARLVSNLPSDGKILSQYVIGNEMDKSTITIIKKPNELKYIYHVMPPEYFLNEDFQNLLHLSRNVLMEHQPKAEEFTDPERTRKVFFNVAKDLLNELATNKGISISYNELNLLASILIRYTIGFGLLEILLQDKNIQDIVLNAPISLNPIFVRHSKYDECFTNIILSQDDAESWTGKFRMISGRALDEANPILDTELILENARARISIVQKPLSPNGISFAVRRHRDYPWTLPLFIKNKMLNPFSAGLLSFLIDGARTILIAGTRSSGKTSLLGALMLEIKPKHRIIVIEDTLELPTDYFRKVGYDVLSMKVRSSLQEIGNETSAEEGIRTSLRLGDSSLIIGEIRSKEAKSLYEAMRVGALANVVAGTVHGSSPYSVFDRIVNDLQVPITSFKATDLILVANPVRTPDGLHSNRRVIQLTEVRKNWTKDPLREKGFVDLLNYDVSSDELKPSEDLINGNIEVIKEIASQVKGWAGNWDAVYDNIILRGMVKQEIVELAEKMNMPEILEAKFNVLSNAIFYEVSDEIRMEFGIPSSNKVFPEWKKRILKEIKKISN
ncbi:MAG: type II/IV secretion system ATPase subunit [Candidatus Pacearchaeota archaeon]